MKKEICKDLIKFIHTFNFKLSHYSTDSNDEICYMYETSTGDQNMKICLFIDIGIKKCLFLHCINEQYNIDMSQDEIYFSNLYSSYNKFLKALKKYYGGDL